MGKKYKDRNGFLHLEGTPISRVQIAPYTGKQIDVSGEAGLEPKKIYYVYRSAKELFNKETMKSFDGMPFKVGHQMLGKGQGNVKSVDSTPIDGCFMNVRRSEDRPDYLIADIVIYTDRALRAIANGTKELSLGYRCAYVPHEGVYEGQEYQFLQTNITANHLALVPHGRAGSTVCVQDEAIIADDGLIVTCDSLPEEIQVMEKDEKKAKDKLIGLLKGSEENVQDCLDYCDLTEEQKKAVKAMKNGKSAEDVPAEDKACCDGKKGCAKDEMPAPPPPPPAEEEKEEGGKEGGEEAPAKEEPAEETPAAEKTEEGKKEEAPAEEKPAEEKPTITLTPAEGDDKGEGETKPAEEKPAEETPATDEDVVKTEEKPSEEVVEKVAEKIYTQDEMEAAIAKAKKEGRRDGLRAKALAEAVGEDCGDDTEAEVARKACKKIKGLERYAEDSASDSEVLAAIRGHLATKVAEDEAPVSKKTLLTMAQDEAIAKTPRTFSAVNLNKYLGAH